MNSLGCVLGLLPGIKFAIYLLTGYQNLRWDRKPNEPPGRPLKWLTRSLAILTILIIGYCLISALNARSAWDPAINSFHYYGYISWLPHSYDSPSSWFRFWQYLGLGFVFWAAWHWLLGKTQEEQRAERNKDSERLKISPLPTRLQRLLWLASSNGGLLALEGIIQRLSGTPNLLWFMPTHMNKEALVLSCEFAGQKNVG